MEIGSVYLFSCMGRQLFSYTGLYFNVLVSLKFKINKALILDKRFYLESIKHIVVQCFYILYVVTLTAKLHYLLN